MRRTLPGLIGAVLLLVPMRTWSNEGSNESSAQSNDSSQTSNDSSADSNQSSEQSSNDSTQGTAESLGQSAVATVVIGAVVLTVGASVGGTILLAQRGKKVQPVQLEQFLQRNHDVLLREIVAAEGPVFSDLLAGSGCTGSEVDTTLRTLDGSSHQVALLAALDGPITSSNAFAFAEAYYGLIASALPPERVRELVQQAQDAERSPQSPSE